METRLGLCRSWWQMGIEGKENKISSFCRFSWFCRLQHLWTASVGRSFPHKRGLKPLGSIRATGQEMRDGHCVLHSTVQLQPAITSLSFKLKAWFKYQMKVRCVYFVTVSISQKVIKSTQDPFRQKWSRLTCLFIYWRLIAQSISNPILHKLKTIQNRHIIQT